MWRLESQSIPKHTENKYFSKTGFKGQMCGMEHP